MKIDYIFSTLKASNLHPLKISFLVHERKQVGFGQFDVWEGQVLFFWTWKILDGTFRLRLNLENKDNH
jgi:hypothetical protein